MKTVVGPETQTRSIVKITEKKDGPRVIETLVKVEKYKALEEAVQKVGLFGSKFSGRKLLKISPLLPALLTYWDVDGCGDLCNFEELLVEKTRALGLPAGIIKEQFVTSFSRGIGTELSPVAAVVGGVLGQDVLNVLGQKEQPIQNLFLFRGDTSEGPIYTL